MPATIREAGRDAAAPAVQQLDKAVQETVKTGQELAAMIDDMRGKKDQRVLLFWLFVIGYLVGWGCGAVTFPRLAAYLPFGWNEQAAAFEMHAERWDAGADLMRASDPEQWNRRVAAWDLVGVNKVNAAAIAGCETAAARTRKAENCQIVVPAPRQ